MDLFSNRIRLKFWRVSVSHRICASPCDDALCHNVYPWSESVMVGLALGAAARSRLGQVAGKFALVVRCSSDY
jgi:hypothetical protein